MKSNPIKILIKPSGVPTATELFAEPHMVLGRFNESSYSFLAEEAVAAVELPFLPELVSVTAGITRFSLADAKWLNPHRRNQTGRINRHGTVCVLPGNGFRCAKRECTGGTQRPTKAKRRPVRDGVVRSRHSARNSPGCAWHDEGEAKELMARYRPGPYLPPTPERVNRLPKWAREYLLHTFVGAEEVQEIFFLRDQNRALIKLVAELKAENRRLVKRLKK